MSSDKKTILIFKIKYNVDSASNTTIRYIEVEFIADDKTKVVDIFPFFNDALRITENETVSCTRFCRFIRNSIRITAIDDFPLLLFLKLNEFDFDDINVEYCFGGIGVGEYVNDKIKLFMPSSEKNHQHSPHIHVSIKGNDVVVFNLEPIRIRNGNITWRTKYSRKEKKNIEKCLEDNKDKFVCFYNDLAKGRVPEPVEFYYNNSLCILKQENKTL